MKYRSRIRIQIISTLVVIFVLLQSLAYIDLPAGKPLQPETVRYTQKAVAAGSAQQVAEQAPPKPVLKQVTPEDMRALDLRQPCGFSASEIESVTKFNLNGLGGNFAEQDNRVNAIFLMSVAALESGWGRHRLTAYNLFGIYYYQPQSYAECISHAANLLATKYLVQDGEWYNGVTVSAVNINYCVNPDGSPKTTWTDEVSGIMADMYNQIYLAEYQQALALSA